MPKNALLLLFALVVLQVPFLTRPVHYDEANFLVLARGAATDPWRPHDVRINWQGTEERAFDVLSNPPGIAWWLAPVVDAPVPMQRAWMLPWLGLALFGAARLGARFGGTSRAGAVLLTSPIVLLSTPSLLPDAPLYALTLAGVGGYVHAMDRGRPALGWAVLAGSAALFRYSGLALVPLLALYPLLRRKAPWAAFGALLPTALLALHDVHAYGELHVLAMGRFQSVATTGGDVLHKAIAATAMLGGAAALPLFRWGRAAMAGALIGGVAGAFWGPVGALFGALGGAALGQVANVRSGDDAWLAAWAFGGLAFLLTLRFTATRYWLPFLPGVLLVVPGRARVPAGIALGILLLADEGQSARGQAALADAVARLAATGGYTGHWGWQWAMEKHGWKALDEGARPESGTLVAMPREAWPQPVEVACAAVVWEGAAVPQIPWLPRGYSAAAEANLHANWIAGRTPVRTIVPWWFATDPYERVRVCRE